MTHLHSRLRRLLLRSLFVGNLVGALCEIKGLPQPIEVSGYFVMTNLSPDGEALQVFERQFSARFDACHWFFRIVPVKEMIPTNVLMKYNLKGPSDRGSGLFEYFEIGCDGSQICHVSQYSKERIASQRQDINSCEALVEQVPIPHDLVLSGIQPIWLAYGSFCYFQALEPGRAQRISGQLSRVGESSDGIRAVWNLPDNGPVEKVTYYENNKDASAEYRVLAWTNLNVQRIPLRATFLEFATAPSDDPVGGSRSSTIRSVDIVATDVRVATSNVSFIPHIPGKSVVSDFRVGPPRKAASHSVVYFMTNSAWPNTDSTIVTKAVGLLNSVNPNLKSHSVPAPATRWPRIVTILVCTLPPLIYVLAFGIKRFCRKTN